MSVRAVFLDVGETLIDESRLWHLWADWLDVPRATFDAALHDVIARREDHRRVFDVLRPDLAPFDVAAAREARRAAGWPDDAFEPRDLYPDAVPCLRALHAHGWRVGIVGNQPAAAESMLLGALGTLGAAGAVVDVVASSERWGVAKPSPAFFARVAAAAGAAPGETAYVGDRLDNDVLPAIAAGMVGVFLRRGPWGAAHAAWPEAARATVSIDSLAALPAALAALPVV